MADKVTFLQHIAHYLSASFGGGSFEEERQAGGILVDDTTCCAAFKPHLTAACSGPTSDLRFFAEDIGAVPECGTTTSGPKVWSRDVANVGCGNRTAFSGSHSGSGSITGMIGPFFTFSGTSSGTLTGGISGAITINISGSVNGAGTTGSYTGTITGAVTGTCSGSFSGGNASTSWTITSPGCTTMTGAPTFSVNTGNGTFTFGGNLSGFTETCLAVYGEIVVASCDPGDTTLTFFDNADDSELAFYDNRQYGWVNGGTELRIVRFDCGNCGYRILRCGESYAAQNATWPRIVGIQQSTSHFGSTGLGLGAGQNKYDIETSGDGDGLGALAEISIVNAPFLNSLNKLGETERSDASGIGSFSLTALDQAWPVHNSQYAKTYTLEVLFNPNSEYSVLYGIPGGKVNFGTTYGFLTIMFHGVVAAFKRVRLSDSAEIITGTVSQIGITATYLSAGTFDPCGPMERILVGAQFITVGSNIASTAYYHDMILDSIAFPSSMTVDYHA